MALYRLPRETLETFIHTPELAMGFQLGIRSGSDPSFSWQAFQSAWQQQRLEQLYFLIIGSQVAVTFNEGLSEQLATLAGLPWGPLVDGRNPDFERWYSSLTNLPVEIVPPAIPRDGFGRYEAMEVGRAIAGVIFHGPIGTLPPVPPRPAYIYGHMQIFGDTGPDDVFYRYEYFPRSLRVDQTNKTVAKDTYAAPFAEAPFVSTGFGAVARFALPTLVPARWRWELQPKAGTRIRMGASVPLYGQSGGGVEVMLEYDLNNQAGPIPNRGPIANQVVLPVI
jgi:hypothetical protein